MVERIRELDGVALEEVAVLLRTNARSADFEEAFHEAGMPFQGASLLARDAARQLLKALRGARGPLRRRSRCALGTRDSSTRCRMGLASGS